MAGEPEENPHRNVESMQSPHRQVCARLQHRDLLVDAMVQTTASPCRGAVQYIQIKLTQSET